jgi:hypothetical protein
MFVAVIITAVLIGLALSMVLMARKAENAKHDRISAAAALASGREWSKYAGMQTGADMIGFIIRHKNMCDIVIVNSDWDSHVVPGLTDGRLILGLSDARNLPDYYWSTAFLFDVVLAGDGSRRYNASLLYDGQLTPGEGNTVTGIEFREA